MTLASAEQNKEIYRTLHDRIAEKRFHATSPIRRHAHRMQYQAFLDLIPPGSSVLDAGCGEGTLSILLAQHGCRVHGIDISEPNVGAARKYAAEQGVADRATFAVGDIEKLPVSDASYDYVVSSHVLEHIPDFTQGVRELSRVAKTGAVVAIPTCLNPCAWVLLGGDKYWTFSRHTPYAIFLGLARVVIARLRGDEGVNEGYSGRSDLIHIWRFPSVGVRLLEGGGLRVKGYRASTFILPYLPFLLPLTKLLERFRAVPGLRNWGYGTTFVCEPLSTGSK